MEDSLDKKYSNNNHLYKQSIEEAKEMPGSKRNYIKISYIIILSFILNAFILIFLNLHDVEKYFISLIGTLNYEILNQFFYGAIGATITSSIFYSKDIEINALEALKEKPNPEVLRFPNRLNVILYIHRILTSGLLAILGAFIIIGGFSYLNIELNNLVLKHKVLLAISSFLIGLYQHKFLRRLRVLFDELHKSEERMHNKTNRYKDKKTSDDINDDIGK